MGFNADDIAHVIPEEVTRPIYEHEYLLSFVHDEGAILFDDWWHAKGKDLFAEWVKTRPDNYTI